MIHPWLDIVVRLVWALLTLVAIVYVLRVRRKQGIKVALKRLLTIRWLLSLLLAVGLSIVNASLIFIYPQQIAVVVATFLQQGIRQQPITPGLNWVFPFVERPLIYPIAWQIYTLSDATGIGHRDDAIHARSLDGQTIIVDCSIIFRIDPEQVIAVHIQWQDRYAKDLLRPLVRGFLRREIARYRAHEFNASQRDTVLTKLEQELKQVGRQNGLIVKAFLLRNLTFTADYAKSVEQKQVAYQKKALKRYQARQIENLAQGTAEKIKLLASAQAEAMVIKADARAQARIMRKQAEARALELLGEALVGNHKLLTYRYVKNLSPHTGRLVLTGNKLFTLPASYLQLIKPAPDSLPSKKPISN